MASEDANYSLVGILEGHRDWVTSISTPADPTSDTIISASRDKQLLVWNVSQSNSSTFVGSAKKALTGHSQCVQDVAISTDGQFALSGSWDRSLRLWDLEKGVTVRSFIGHTDDVNTVAFSVDNRQIVSGGRDRTIKMWNTVAECKYTLTENQHQDWVSCVRFSPLSRQPLIVSCGWDKLVKVWALDSFSLHAELVGHRSPLYTLTISPDGSLCASGGREGVAMLWDVTEGKHLYSLPCDNVINSLCFSPCNYWLCAGTNKSIQLWDLESKKILKEIKLERTDKSGVAAVNCLSWSADGNTLYAGCTDGKIYVHRRES